MIIGALIGLFITLLFFKFVYMKHNVKPENVVWEQVFLDAAIASLLGAIIGYFVS